jgi:hypothetical protein
VFEESSGTFVGRRRPGHAREGNDMTSYCNIQELDRPGDLSLRAHVSHPALSSRLDADNAQLNPMIMKSISWREMGMVCGSGTAAKIADIGGTDVTFTKFSTHVGPGSASPPV